MVFQLLLSAVLPYIVGEGAAAAAGASAGGAAQGAAGSAASGAASSAAGASAGATGAASGGSLGASLGAAPAAAEAAPAIAAAPPQTAPAPQGTTPVQGPTPSGNTLTPATAAPTPIQQNDWFKLALKMLDSRQKQEKEGPLNGLFNPMLYQLGLKDRPALKPLGGAQGPLTQDQQQAYTMAQLLSGPEKNMGLLGKGVSAIRGLI